MQNDKPSAEIIAIDRGERAFMSELDGYEQNQTLNKFLNAFELAVCNKLTLMPKLVESLKKNGVGKWSSSDIDRLQDFIASLNFKNTPDLRKERKSKTDDIEDFVGSFEVSENSDDTSVKLEGSQRFRVMTDKEFNESINQFTKGIRENNEYMDGLLLKDSPYYFFSPALEIEEQLKADFIEAEDPARKLAEYLRASFAYPHKGKINEHTAKTNIDKSTLACLWILIGSIKINDYLRYPSNNETDPESLIICITSALKYLILFPLAKESQENECSDDIEDEMEISESDTWLIATLSNAYYLRQSLFDCLLEHQFNSDQHHAAAPVIFHTLCQLPFGVSYCSRGEYDTGTDKYHAQLFGKHGWDDHWDKLPFIKWRYVEQLIDTIFSAYDTASVILPSAGYRLIMTKFSNYRKKHGGYSPFGVGRTAELWVAVRFHVDDANINYDPILFIGGLFNTALFGPDQGLGCSWLLDEDQNVIPDNLAMRSSHYLSLAESVFNDGMSEFASAILGFFLYSQCLFARDGIHTDQAKLASLLRRGLNNPGRQLLETSLERAVGRLDVTSAPIEAKVLSSYIRPRPSLVAFNPVQDKVTPTPPNKAIIKANLAAKYPLVFDRFGKDSQELLIDAELIWSKMSGEFGSGVGDWGTLAVALTKPLEVELVTRLDMVYLSEEYRCFHKDSFHKDINSKVTFGGIVHMLKAHKMLPESIKAAIFNSGVKLPIDPNLLRSLDNILRFRNKGAHSDPFSGEDYHKLRKALFDENGLMLIAESLISI